MKKPQSIQNADSPIHPLTDSPVEGMTIFVRSGGQTIVPAESDDAIPLTPNASPLTGDERSPI